MRLTTTQFSTPAISATLIVKSAMSSTLKFVCLATPTPTSLSWMAPLAKPSARSGLTVMLKSQSVNSVNFHAKVAPPVLSTVAPVM